MKLHVIWLCLFFSAVLFSEPADSLESCTKQCDKYLSECLRWNRNDAGGIKVCNTNSSNCIAGCQRRYAPPKAPSESEINNCKQACQVKFAACMRDIPANDVQHTAARQSACETEVGQCKHGCER